MNRIRLAAVATALAVATAIGGASAGTAQNQAKGPPDTYVTSWDSVGAQAFTAAALSPAEGMPIFAYTAIAVYDSVMAIDGRYEAFAVDADAPDGASPEAAVAAAAHTVLAHYLPAQRGTILDPAYVASLATIPDGTAKTWGIGIGEAVAALLIAERADDGFRAPVTYTPPNPPIPGVWIPTAPTPPLGTYLGLMRPFAIESADQFRPDGPPALTSKRWARDYNEVKTIGSSTSTARTPEQTLQARFWGEPPVQQARAAFRKVVLDHGLDVADAARFMAMTSVSAADGLIACFDAKYHYRFWRPITAIRAGDTDGNEATVADPTWSTLLPGTPNHPEYPSAHSCATSAAGLAVARFLGTDRIDFTVPSLTGLGDRHFDTVRALEDDVANARVYGGIHYRSSVEDGLTIGTRTADWVLAHNFHRSRK
jgi:vanadium-dependent haloperoxidase-like protein